jgi:N-acetyl-anhydromuramyl-L-alanine amidase AmpD
MGLIENYHTHPIWRNNFYGTGYHFVIGRDGTIYEGRPFNVYGAHARGLNQTSIGIAVIGNFEPGTLFGNQTPTDVQMESLIALVNILKDGQGISNVIGHRNHSAGNECPGQNLYDIVRELWPR